MGSMATTRPAIDAGTWEKIASGELRVCHADGCSNVFTPSRKQQRFCELETCTRTRKPCAWCGEPKPPGKRSMFCDSDACAAERREASKQLSVTGLPRYAVRLALRSFRDADARGRATGGGTEGPAARARGGNPRRRPRRRLRYSDIRGRDLARDRGQGEAARRPAATPVERHDPACSGARGARRGGG